MRLRTACRAAVVSVALASGCLSAASSAYGAFGISAFEFSANEAPSAGAPQGARGAPDLRAGSHPWSLTTSVKLNRIELIPGQFAPDGAVRDVHALLPPGLVGDPNAVPKCSTRLFNTPGDLQFGLDGASCPNNTQVGVALVEVQPDGEGEPVPLEIGIYNLVPRPGVPAEFGFNPLGIPIILTPAVRTGDDYGLTVSSIKNNEGERVFGVTTTFWGVPSDPSHDEYRGECLLGEARTIHRTLSRRGAAEAAADTPDRLLERRAVGIGADGFVAGTGARRRSRTARAE